MKLTIGKFVKLAQAAGGWRSGVKAKTRIMAGQVIYIDECKFTIRHTPAGWAETFHLADIEHGHIRVLS